MLHVVILAGGGGTRLWPLSRTHYPKQFLRLLGDQTLLQQTVLRVREVISEDRLWIVTGQEQEFLIHSQLAALSGLDARASHILAEPAPRNTAAAIGLAALHIVQHDPQAVMVVLPADHWIERQQEFLALLASAVELAQREALVTLGIVPTRPETGYGYIQRGARVWDKDFSPQVRHEAYRVAQFVEKPSAPVAQAYLASGDSYWNAGIFIWRAATILTEIATHLPQLHRGLETLAPSLARSDYTDSLVQVYRDLDAISIDHGVLEKSSRLLVLPAEIGWSDLGEWTTIHRLSPRDERGNTRSGNVLDVDSNNTFVYGNGRVVATIGLKDTVVIDTDDALLVCAQDRTQEVKTVVQQLQARQASVVHTARTVNRPWGTYTVLEEGPNFKVKRLVVHPGKAISLQLHRQRSEHWVVVSGAAHVTNGEHQFILEVNQSTYVPAGTIHRLANRGSTPLEIIEVQTGSYVGEDDILRFDPLP
jgi:mannose-1-phosphate guanylyltransferase/mannose-6-phosphate isomerase